MKTTAIESLQSFLNSNCKKDKNRVLEAGCGSLSHVAINGNNYVIGIDISQEQLDKNTDLDEKILGDIQQFPFKEGDYDVIISWDVLEHLDQPRLALLNFTKAIAKNGIIIVAVPNVNSMKGMITKYTPHWFHVLVYKYIFKKKDAGQPGCAPFPTVLSYDIAPESLEKFASDNGLKIIFMKLYDAFPRIFTEKRLIAYNLYKLSSQLMKIVSLGRLGGKDNTDFVCVLQKP